MKELAGRNEHLSILCNHRTLLKEEEEDLVRKMRAGDDEARDKLVRYNFRLIVSVVAPLVVSGIELDDLFQEGVLGFLYSLEKFDPAIGTPLQLYAAISVKRFALDHIDKNRQNVRRSSFFWKRRRWVRKIQEIHYQKFGTRISVAHVSQILKYTSGTTKEISIFSYDCSLDMTVVGKDGTHNIFTNIADQSVGFEKKIECESEFLRIKKVLADLKRPPESKQKFLLRYGLEEGGNYEMRDYEEIARMYDITTSAVASTVQRIEKALRRKIPDAKLVKPRKFPPRPKKG